MRPAVALRAEAVLHQALQVHVLTHVAGRQ